jgi:hypothetical protein
MSKIIRKKVYAEHYKNILSGRKTFEVRLNDWACEPGDTLILQEITEGTRQPTGRELTRTVGTITKTQDLDYWTAEEIAEHGYQVISLLDTE